MFYAIKYNNIYNIKIVLVLYYYSFYRIGNEFEKKIIILVNKSKTMATILLNMK